MSPPVLRIPGTTRAIAVAMGPEYRFPQLGRRLRIVKPLDGRTAGGKVIAPLIAGWRWKQRTAAAKAITAGILAGETNGQIVRAMRRGGRR